MNATHISNVQVDANTTGNGAANITVVANATANVTANVSANVSNVANSTANATTDVQANATAKTTSRYEEYINQIQNDLGKPAPKVEKSTTELAIPDYDASGVDIKFVDTNKPDMHFSWAIKLSSIR